MKTRRPITLPDDSAIPISFTSGRVIRLRPSELAVCELVAGLLRKATTKSKRRAFQIIGARKPDAPPTT